VEERLMFSRLSAVVSAATRGLPPAGAVLVSWQGAERWVGAASGLFLLVFLVISTIALCRADVKDIPETVRALAQLLHPRAARRSQRESPADGEGEDASRR
jgi:hypothetical protein